VSARLARGGCDWTAIRLFGLAFAALLWMLVSRTMADPDLWGHLRFGLDILAERALPAIDRYSFASDRPWINHEWLAELLMAIAYTAGGVIGLNLLKVAAIAVLGLVVTAAFRKEGAAPWFCGVVAGITILATYTRMQGIRPQIFAVALFAVVLYCMRSFDRGRDRAIWSLPLCFVLWVNLHGSWIVGLSAVAVWTAVGAYERRPSRATLQIAVGLVTAGATLLNPYGIGLWQFLFETVRFERVDISEWRPLLAMPISILIVEAIVPAIVITGWMQTKRRVPLRYIAVLLLLWAATLKTSRVDAFAQTGTVILLGPELLAALAAGGRAFRSPFWRTKLPMGIVPAVLALAIFGAGVLQMRQIPVVGYWTPDEEAASFLRTTAHGSRVLTWFDWGEYAIWHLSPSGIRVSMDGRRETVYSGEVLRRHWAFYSGEIGEMGYPEEIGADYIWVPRDLPVAAALPLHGWYPRFESSRSIVFGRQRSGPPTVSAQAAVRLGIWP
jgi:hypothetical protein